MGNLHEGAYIIVGINCGQEDPSALISRYGLVKNEVKLVQHVWDLPGKPTRHSWDPKFVRRISDPPGTERYQIKIDDRSDEKYLGKVFAKAGESLDPSKLEQTIREVRIDLPEAEAFLCLLIREAD